MGCGQDARKNRKDAQGLCEKISELANAIAGMAQVIQLGLDKFKTDPTARAQYEQNIKMSRDLVDRVVTLHKFVIRAGVASTKKLNYNTASLTVSWTRRAKYSGGLGAAGCGIAKMTRRR